MTTRFKLYSGDIIRLVEQVSTRIDDQGREIDSQSWKDWNGRRRFEHADFDVGDDGIITIHVEGKEPLSL